MDYQTFKGTLLVLGFAIDLVDKDVAFTAKIKKPKIFLMALGDWKSEDKEKPLIPNTVDMYIKGSPPMHCTTFALALQKIKGRLSDTHS